MEKNKIIVLKIVLSVIVLVMAIIRFFFFELIYEKMDLTFIILVLAAIVIPIFPWERVERFKAAGIEVSLKQKQIEGAINSVNLGQDPNLIIENENLQEKLREIVKNNTSKIGLINGSRILWIDDHPENIIGERRLIRNLGIEVVMVDSSELAQEKLILDNDFDMIITDIQRRGNSLNRVMELDNNYMGHPIHEGVNFLVKLRLDPNIKYEIVNIIPGYEYGEEIDLNAEADLLSYIKSIPVVFYAAYKWEDLVRWTRPAREILPESKISNSVDDLLAKVIETLSDVRLNPLILKVKKGPTAPR